MHRLTSGNARTLVVAALAASGAALASCGGSSSSTTLGATTGTGGTGGMSTMGTGGTGGKAGTGGTGGMSTTGTGGVSTTGTGGAGGVSTTGTGGAGGAGTTGTGGAGGVMDAGVDASCGPDDSPCNNAGESGLCKAGVCSTCTDVTDDASCAAAYNGVYLCLFGACTPGNCRADGDCTNPTGQICGLGTPNFCGLCTGDSQCQADPTYGPGDLCTVGTGACAPATCNVADDTLCAANPADVCCGGSCTPGDCCDTAYCHTKFGNNYTCSLHTCSQCDAVNGKTYVVDPLHGDDGSATGNPSAGGVATPSCAFKTISRALQVIGPNPGSSTLIQVLPTGPVGAGETFPIVVPANVTVAGSGAVTVDVPAGKGGFRLVGSGASLASLNLDGANHTAGTGIAAETGTDATSTLTQVHVQNMGGSGIVVTGTGKLSVASGVVSSNNGTAAARASGILVSGLGQLYLDVAAGGTAVQLISNTDHALGVLESGQAIVGTMSAVTPVAVMSGSGYANVYIEQTPAAAPTNTLQGVQIAGSLGTYGIHIFGGSALKLRASSILSNKHDGVYISTYSVNGTVSDNVALIDLGTAGDLGHNVLQSTAASMQANGGSGICLGVNPAAGAMLNAQGNTFEGIDCSTANPASILRSKACKAGTDIATPGKTETNDILTANCPHL